jgi:hypothetical protein
MRSTLLAVKLAGVVVVAWLGGAASAQAAAPAENGKAADLAQAANDALALVESFQSGYRQVAAIATYQIYYSTGLIASDFSNGYIDSATATFALQQNSLLHSACLTTINDVLVKLDNYLRALIDLYGDPGAEAVPREKERQELQRIKDVLLKEDDLLRALSDLFGNPSAEAAATAEQARQAVSAALDEYAKPAAQ